MNSIDSFFLMSLVVFIAGLLWAMRNFIHALAGSIEVWIRRKRLRYGSKPKFYAVPDWKPKPPTIPFWQFWNPKSGCFLAFIICLIAFLLRAVVQHISH